MSEEYQEGKKRKYLKLFINIVKFWGAHQTPPRAPGSPRAYC